MLFIWVIVIWSSDSLGHTFYPVYKGGIIQGEDSWKAFGYLNKGIFNTHGVNGNDEAAFSVLYLLGKEVQLQMRIHSGIQRVKTHVGNYDSTDDALNPSEIVFPNTTNNIFSISGRYSPDITPEGAIWGKTFQLDFYNQQYHFTRTLLNSGIEIEARFNALQLNGSIGFYGQRVTRKENRIFNHGAFAALELNYIWLVPDDDEEFETFFNIDEANRSLNLWGYSIFIGFFYSNAIPYLKISTLETPSQGLKDAFGSAITVVGGITVFIF